MKKRGCLLFVLSILVIAVLIGCAAPAPSPTTTPTQPPVPTPPKVTTTELSLSLTFPEPVPLSKAIQAWAKTLNERTNNQVKINIYYSGALLKTEEAFRGVQTGAADMASYVVGSDPGMMPLNEFTRLPFLGWSDWKTAHLIYIDMMNKKPELKNEWQGLKVYGTYMMPPYELHTTKKPVRLPTDLTGMKILAQSELATVMQLAGASPVDQTVTEWYMAMEKGVAEGCATHFALTLVFNLHPLLKYHTVFGGSGICLNPQMIIMNPDSWKKLPPDVQKVFNELEPEFTKALIEADIGTQEAAKGIAMGKGDTMVVLTPEDIALWAKTVQAVQDDWVKTNEAKGKPAKALLEEVKKAIQSGK